MFRRDFLTKTGATAATIAAPAFIDLNIGALAEPTTLTPLAVSGRDELITHGDGNPSLVVEYDDAENREDLRTWAESQNNGRVLREIPSLNMMAISVPWDAAGRSSLFGFTRYGGGLEDLNYVSVADANSTIGIPSPVGSPDAADTVSLSGALSWGQRLSLAVRSFSTSTDAPTGGLQFDGAPEATLTQAREHVRASDTVVSGVDTSNVTVAVIDTGVNTSANLAADRLHDESTGFAKTNDPTVADDGESAVSDGDGHGSWVAHCIAGTNGFAPDAEVLALKALADDGSGSTADIVAAVEKAVDVGADVACMSLGSPMWSQALADALEQAYGAGVFPVVASGNSRYSTVWIASPADTDPAFGVNACNVPDSGDRDDTKLAYFGNVGPDPGVPDMSEGKSNGAQPKLAAPGMNVTVEPTGQLSGTSMAAPMVVGGATLLAADGHAPDEITDRLTKYAYPLPHAGETEAKHGLLDVQAAIEGTEPSDSPSDVRTTEAAGRDEFNRQLSRAMGGFLGQLL